MSLAVKDGVRLPAQIAVPVAIMVCNEVLTERDHNCVITSGLEGSHRRGSLHYIGHAFDIRTSAIPEEDRESIRREIAGRIGADFDVVLEATHFHIEYQPKTGINA